MKKFFNPCDLYLLLCILCSLNGTLYHPGGIVAQGLQAILILSSLYYAIYANLKYKLSPFFLALNVLLIMFSIYGFLYILSGEQLMVAANWNMVSNSGYLKSIYKSLLPIYVFYVFTRQGYLNENKMRFWFFVFLFLAIRSFYRSQAAMLRAAYERGSITEEFTNNVAYSFVGLLPALLLFKKHTVVQYALLAVCSYFIIMGMKRGAILIALLCLFWFLFVNLKTTSKRKKRMLVILTGIIVGLGAFYVNYMIDSSAYFRYRIAQTREGGSSGRDELYSLFYSHFINESNPFLFLFGNGANGTLKIGSNYAHNDWLEIAIGQGLIGVLIYAFYWIGFCKDWLKLRNFSQAYIAIGMCFMIYFLETIFSMSYNSVSRCSAMIIGYFFAITSSNKCYELEGLSKY